MADDGREPGWLFRPPTWSSGQLMGNTCPEGPHRGPQGPNEDLAQCHLCWSPSFARRPAGETFGQHAEDCSLPVDHLSYCVGGGAGHPLSTHERGYFPARGGSVVRPERDTQP